MVAVLNFISYIAASLLSVYFYAKSVSPAQLERKIGDNAYTQCARHRIIATILMLLALVNFVLCRKYPITRSLPLRFGWPVWLSITLAVLLGIPALTLMIMGIQDAGMETVAPRKDGALFSQGIYKRIRHPQAYEALLWPALAMGLNSPLLFFISLPWLLLEIIMVMAEEFDLALRYGQPYLDYRDQTGAFIPLDWLKKDTLKDTFQPILEKIQDLFDKD